MTHFVAMVVVPPNEINNEDYLADMLWYWDENRTVEPYADEEGNTTTYNQERKFDYWTIISPSNPEAWWTDYFQSPERPSEALKRLRDIYADRVPPDEDNPPSLDGDGLRLRWYFPKWVVVDYASFDYGRVGWFGFFRPTDTDASWMTHCESALAAASGDARVYWLDCHI